jgi:endonuclease I
MKLKIETWFGLNYKIYVIAADNANANDKDIAKLLSITVYKYRKILIKCGAKIDKKIRCYGDTFFYDYNNIQNALKELEPYLIMRKLVE